MESGTSWTPAGAPLGATSAEIIGLLRVNRETEARLLAERYELVEALRRANQDEMNVLVRATDSSASREELLRRVTTSEVSLTLLVHERTAAQLIGEAEVLAGPLGRTLDGLRSGALTPARARAVLSAAREVPEQAQVVVQDRVLAGRWDVSLAAWKRRCRTAVEKAHPVSLSERAAAFLAERTVTMSDAGNGLRWLSALLPAYEAEVMFTTLTGRAQDARIGGDVRTLDQLRADALRDAVLGIDDDVPSSSAEPANALRTVRATVVVTVPALSLLHKGADVSTLDGVGPIPQGVAEALAGGDASWFRVLTDPWSGEHLAMGRKRYKVPVPLKRWLRYRMKTCSHPQCTKPAAACDLDHVIPWSEGGRTDAANLAPECEGHHNLSHHSAFTTLIDHDTGDVIWFDPAGNAHHSPPFDGEPPEPPDLSGIRDLFTLPGADGARDAA